MPSAMWRSPVRVAEDRIGVPGFDFFDEVILVDHRSDQTLAAGDRQPATACHRIALGPDHLIAQRRRLVIDRGGSVCGRCGRTRSSCFLLFLSHLILAMARKPNRARRREQGHGRGPVATIFRQRRLLRARPELRPRPAMAALRLEELQPHALNRPGTVNEIVVFLPPSSCACTVALCLRAALMTPCGVIHS